MTSRKQFMAMPMSQKFGNKDKQITDKKSSDNKFTSIMN